MPDITTKEALLERMVTATEEMKSAIPEKFDQYLPTSGGTLNGTITSSVELVLNKTDADKRLEFFSGPEWDSGASISLVGKGYDSNTGGYIIRAHSGATGDYKNLIGLPNGSLTWGGQPIQTSSDRRLKQSFSDVPAEVLDVWGKVEWKQFKYIADVERKGAENCRFHTGLVAQDVKEVGEENNVDLLKYGILCHESNEETPDLWTIRYEEALAMEVIYLRNEIKKLREEIRGLK